MRPRGHTSAPSAAGYPAEECREIINRIIEGSTPPFTLRAFGALADPLEKYKAAPGEASEKQLPTLRACYDELRSFMPVGRWAFVIFDATDKAIILDTSVAEKAFDRQRQMQDAVFLSRDEVATLMRIVKERRLPLPLSKQHQDEVIAEIKGRR